MIRKRTVLIFLALAGLLAYSNSFRVPFHYDDFSFLKEKIIIKSFPLFLNWISGDYLRIITGRAFLLFTFFLNYIINGLDTFGYHIVNLFIHISTAFFFYLLIAKHLGNKNCSTSSDNPVHLTLLIPHLVRGELRGIIAASIFVLHPINTESVTYISSRSSELSALFILSSMLMFFKATENRFSLIPYLLSIFFFILGLSTKEAAIVTPLLIGLFDYYFITEKDKGFRARFKYHLPFWAIVLAGFLYYSRYITRPEMYDRPWQIHIFTELKVFVEYLRLLILPFGLNIDHDIKESISLNPAVILSLAIISSLLLIAVFLIIRNKNKVLSFAILWFFINLAPFLIIRLSDYMTERWVYTAAMGFSLGLGELAMIIFSRYKKIGIVILISSALLFGSLTFLRNNVYKSSVALWFDALKKSPEKIRPYTNLSASYLERGDIEKAIEIMELSIKMGNREVETYLNLANAYFLRDDMKKAEEILLLLNKKAVPDVYHYNLGTIYKFQKKYEKAIEEFKKVIKNNPHSPAVLGSIGECYNFLAQKDKAKEYFVLAIRGIPQNSEDYLVLAKSFFALGEKQKGTESLNKALISDPFNIYVRNIIAATLFENKNYAEAYKHFSIMAKISPNYAPAHKGMGVSTLAKGNIEEARKHFNKTLSLLPPDSPERKEILGLLAKTKGLLD